LILRQPGGISSRLSCLPNPSQPGQPVVVKVYVRPTEPTHSAPRGTVAFTVDGRLVGGATLDASGVAQTQIALPTQWEVSTALLLVSLVGAIFTAIYLWSVRT
jgi:hypothetical protein